MDYVIRKSPINFFLRNMPYEAPVITSRLRQLLLDDILDTPIQMKVINHIPDKKLTCMFRWPKEITEKQLGIQELVGNIRNLTIEMTPDFALFLLNNQRVEFQAYKTIETVYPIKLVYKINDHSVQIHEIPYYNNIHALITMSYYNYTLLQKRFNERKINMKKKEVTHIVSNNIVSPFIPNYVIDELKSTEKAMNIYESSIKNIKNSLPSDNVWVYNIEQEYDMMYDIVNNKVEKLVGGKLQYINNNGSLRLENHKEALEREIKEEWLVDETFTLELFTFFNLSNTLIGVFKFSFIM
uniref:Uncharacterized protein n=1 Tax=viral metagenome TaxID=1070528 RepID=A0A6C0M0C5_9ZZZZ